MFQVRKTSTFKFIDHNSNFQLLTEKLEKLNRILNEGHMDAYMKRYIPRRIPFIY